MKALIVTFAMMSLALTACGSGSNSQESTVSRSVPIVIEPIPAAADLANKTYTHKLCEQPADFPANCVEWIKFGEGSRVYTLLGGNDIAEVGTYTWAPRSESTSWDVTVTLDNRVLNFILSFDGQTLTLGDRVFTLSL